MTKRLIPVIACALFFSAVMGCTKKEDPAIAALQAQMQAMQAEHLQSVYPDEGPGTYTRASGGTLWAREAHGARG